ncbi:dsrm domain protein [Ceratobasidium sp. AG-Ba]|nr:dsrm domain protein [Ceratobasidium sp. AG-Ba]QRW01643.1 dsrm domain protein [Ceratobasidium sp. AG-Ba]
MTEYEAYRKLNSDICWLDALGGWINKAKSIGASINWTFVEEREPDNTVIHTAVPVLSYRLFNHTPVGSSDFPLRATAATREEAEAGAQDVVSYWLRRHNRSTGRILLQEREFRVERLAQVGHTQFVARLSQYSCYLEDWPVSECRGIGRSKKEAQNNAAQKLIQGNQYCVFPRRGRHRS